MTMQRSQRENVQLPNSKFQRQFTEWYRQLTTAILPTILSFWSMITNVILGIHWRGTAPCVVYHIAFTPPGPVADVYCIRHTSASYFSCRGFAFGVERGHGAPGVGTSLGTQRARFGWISRAFDAKVRSLRRLGWHPVRLRKHDTKKHNFLKEVTFKSLCENQFWFLEDFVALSLDVKNMHISNSSQKQWRKNTLVQIGEILLLVQADILSADVLFKIKTSKWDAKRQIFCLWTAEKLSLLHWKKVIRFGTSVKCANAPASQTRRFDSGRRADTWHNFVNGSWLEFEMSTNFTRNWDHLSL